MRLRSHDQRKYFEVPRMCAMKTLTTSLYSGAMLLIGYAAFYQLRNTSANPLDVILAGALVLWISADALEQWKLRRLKTRIMKSLPPMSVIDRIQGHRHV
jgi:hypothetical protein